MAALGVAAHVADRSTARRHFDSPIAGLASAAFPSPICLRIQPDLQAASRPQRVGRLGSSVILGDHADSTANREHDFSSKH
jgi:hypothetical protein